MKRRVRHNDSNSGFQFTIPVLTSLIPLSAIFLLPMTGANLGELGNVFGLLASVYPALDPILIIVSISRHVLVIAVSMLFPSRFSFRTTLQRWVHVLLGSTASINERKALERSRRQTALLHSISMNMLWPNICNFYHDVLPIKDNGGIKTMKNEQRWQKWRGSFRSRL